MRIITIKIRYEVGDEINHPYLGFCTVKHVHICNEYYPDYTLYSYDKDNHYRLSEKAIYQATQ